MQVSSRSGSGCVVGLVGVGTVGLLLSEERSSTAMATAATKFVASLTAEQKQKASFAFDADERMRWHFIPPARRRCFRETG